MGDQMENQEPNAAQLRGVECAILHQHAPSDCRDIPDQTPAVKFKKLGSRTGHARFRRGPAPPPSAELQETPPAVNPAAAQQNNARAPAVPRMAAAAAVPPAIIFNFDETNERSDSFAMLASSSLLPSHSGDDGCDGKRSSVVRTTPAVVLSAGKPPLAPSYKRKCSERALHAEDAKKAVVSRTHRCHCSKKRSTHLP